MKNTITTKAGDRGTTRLYSGELVSKRSDRTEALGDIDELVSALGVARAHVTRADLHETILSLQRTLFATGSEVATTGDALQRLPVRIDATAAQEIDKLRLRLENEIEMPNGFIVPGATAGGAFLDLARSFSRRCERRVVGLVDQGVIDNPHLLVWFNRLSDVLWLMARLEEGRSTPVKET